MKKLTAGIFATILGVTAMGTADAAVTSKGYVDAALATKANTADLATVATTGAYADLTGTPDVYTKTETNGLLDTKADKSVVGTLPAGQSTVVGYIESKTSGIASDETVSELSEKVSALETASATHATTAALDSGLALKADKSTTYTKTETDNLLGAKANSADLATVATTGAYADLTGTPDVYTKTETNNLLGAKANSADLATVATTGAYVDLTGTPDLSDMATKTEVASTYATKNDITGMATETWVKGQGYATSQGVTTVLGDYATKTEAQGYANAKDAAISAAQADATQALADAAAADTKATGAQTAAATAQAAADAAQGDATQALTNAGNAQTAADAANAALNTANKLSDGQYALTMKVVEGVTSYGWELIDREYVSTDVTANGQ